MKRLYRSRYDQKVTGLLGGIANYLNFDATLLRIIVMVFMIGSAGTIMVVYFLASLVVPKEPRNPSDPYYAGGWNHGGGMNGPSGPWNMGGSNRDYQARQQPPQSAQNNGYGYGNSSQNMGQEPTSSLDDMMKDIEKKAMEKEIKELRKKLSNYEKGDL